MMAAPSDSPHFCFFVARADWTDESQYGSALFDPSVAAWELLRRNNLYVQAYREWHDRCIDVLPTPLPKQPLTGYYCDPEPDAPDTPYNVYKEQHPNHFLCPAGDYIREQWGINAMPNPDQSWKDILDTGRIDNENNKLAWLFACNTVEVINSPNIWPTRNYLHAETLLMKASGFCTGTEVMVRLDFTGNLDEQIESLRRQVGEFYEGGNRSGKALTERRPTFREHDEQQSRWQHSPAPDDQGGSLGSIFSEHVLPAFLAVKPDWNSAPAKRKTLPYVVRIADAIAAMEKGTLVAQLKKGNVEGDNLRIAPNDTGQAQSLLTFINQHVDLRRPLAEALFRYFDNGGAYGHLELNVAKISDWIEYAYEFVVLREYKRVARTNALKIKPTRKK